MDAFATSTEVWYQTKEVIAAAAGAGLAFLLVVLYDWLRTRRKRRAHFSALRAEMDYCQSLAQMYLQDKIIAPLYRLPTVAYTNSLPALLSEGALGEPDVRALVSFFNGVETLNRGLEQAEGARLISDPEEQKVKLKTECSRNQLTAAKLVPANVLSPSYYDLAKLVVDSRLRWYRP